MRNSKFSNCCSIFVLTSILLLSFSSTSFSQWVDRSDELEGTSTGTIILIGVVVAAVVVGTILLINSGSDEETDDESGEGKEEEIDTEKNSSGQSEDGTPFSIIQKNLKNEQNEYMAQQIPLNIYLCMKRNNLQFSDNTFEIGVAVNF